MSNELLQHPDLDPSVFPLGQFSKYVVDIVPVFNTNPYFSVQEFMATGFNYLPEGQIVNYVARMSEDRAALALGDLGMFASSLAARGVGLNREAPQLVKHLLALSNATGLPPRDNYYSYTELNQPGPAARTFLGTPEERAFIHYNQKFIEDFRIVIHAYNNLLGPLPWSDAAQTENALLAAQSMDHVAQMMLEIRNTIPAKFFFDMGIFSEPFEVGENSWKNENGETTSLIPKAQVPDANIALIDVLMYGVNDDHAQYLNQMYPHMPFSRRQQLQKIEYEKPASLSERFLLELSDDSTAHTKEAVLEAFHGLWRWRGIHNSAATTHLRLNGRGRRKDGTFKFDRQLLDLKERSKSYFQNLRKATYSTSNERSDK